MAVDITYTCCYIHLECKFDFDFIYLPGSGSIELHEFVNVMLTKMQMMDTEDEIKKVFRVFDRDGNGYINAAELR